MNVDVVFLNKSLGKSPEDDLLLQMLVMGFVRRPYHRVSLETRSATPVELNDLTPPLVILPIQNWNHIVKKALRFALKISPDIRAVHVDCGEGSAAFRHEGSPYVAEPTQQAGVAIPQLVVLPSRYRTILAPIVEYVLETERTCPNQQIAVLIPETCSAAGITTCCTINEPRS